MEGAPEAPSIVSAGSGHRYDHCMRWHEVIPTALLLSACGGGGAATPGSADVPLPSSQPSTVESTVPLEPPTLPTESTLPSAFVSEGKGVPAALLEPVLVDAAARFGVEVGEVTILSAELRDWPDGALGCPVAGMLYTQVVTPGYRVLIEAGGEQLDYRMNRRGVFRLCETGDAIPDIRTPSTVTPSPDS